MNDVLIVVDVQKGLNEIPDFNHFLTRINHRIMSYRTVGKQVIFVQHNDKDMPLNSKSWEFADQLDITNADSVVSKTYPDSFLETNLESILRDNEYTNFEICGAQTEYCIDTTIRVGFHLGYQISVQHDLVGTLNNEIMTAEQINKHHEHIWQGRFAKVF
ncbi:amidase [Paucilactobacillus hokkaidonensis JCM 18461]|uniref:Amidase n=2 Tax=Paucilactobacillus hokkaidonensis TaxID=1193095 RepID=A0A0A1GY37_9LACO|nr:cysteine hydrolase family protein [Paucilactobacillus hokkaidonensis]BAP85809.1 amidase [Paucilactobacillus hokkaidonensis JCM 18461]